jgi:nucleoside-diphosphate-sugar epimerase
MKVAVAGATGFVGEYLIPLLCAKYKEVRCLIRKTTSCNNACLPNVRVYSGDMSDPESLKEFLNGADKFICLVPFSTGYIPSIISLCVKNEIRRAIFVGTTQMFKYQLPEIKKAIVEAEDAITSSALDYTIIRPTMIYGSSRDKNIIRLVSYLKRYPIFFMPGNGQTLQQPVYVKDVVNAVLAVLDSSKTIRKTYNISGRNAITFDEMVEIICKTLQIRRVKIHLPMSMLIGLARFLEIIRIRTFFTADKIRRLAENKDFGYREANKDFNYKPIPFEEGITEAIKRYGLSLK